MLKKYILALCCIAAVALFSGGCSFDEKPIENTSALSSTSLQIPDSICALYDLYKEAKDTQSLSYELSDISSSIYNGTTDFSFSFIEEYSDDSLYLYTGKSFIKEEEYKAYFDESENEFEIRLETVTFAGTPRKPGEQFCKDVILATFYALDPSAGFQQASELTKKLLSSYSEGSISDTVKVNNYDVVLVPDDTGVFDGFTIKCHAYE